MAHIVIIGAGVAGVPAAYELRSKIGKNHRITVVNNREHFEFTPSNPWVGVGWRSNEQIIVPLRKPLSRRDIDFMSSPLVEIDPVGNGLKLADGTSLEYDFLIIATGPSLAFDAIPGLGPMQGYTQSVCTVDHASQAHDEYQKLLQNPGPVVIGAAQGASCFGPAIEYVMIVDRDLCKRKLRHKVPMTYVTSEPYVGHLGLGGVGDTKGILEAEMRMRHIRWICNASIDHVEQGVMHVHEHDSSGAIIKQHQLPFSYSMILPSFRGIDPLMNIEGLVNPKGFVTIDQYQRNTTFTNIYSAGVCVAIPPVEVTPVPTGTPKTGYMIESMVGAITHNIALELSGKSPDETGTWNAVCLADLGNTAIAFAAIPQIPPRNVTWARKGKWAHIAKIGFEKYFMRKIRTGNTDPVYEHYVMKMLGIVRLADKSG